MYWTRQLERFKKAVEERNIESFFIMSAENSRNMKTVYSRMNDIGQFLEWLEMKADEEVSGGGVLRSIGGC